MINRSGFALVGLLMLFGCSSDGSFSDWFKNAGETAETKVDSGSAKAEETAPVADLPKNGFVLVGLDLVDHPALSGLRLDIRRVEPVTLRFEVHPDGPSKAAPLARRGYHLFQEEEVYSIYELLPGTYTIAAVLASDEVPPEAYRIGQSVFSPTAKFLKPRVHQNPARLGERPGVAPLVFATEDHASPKAPQFKIKAGEITYIGDILLGVELQTLSDPTRLISANFKQVRPFVDYRIALADAKAALADSDYDGLEVSLATLSLLQGKRQFVEEFYATPENQNMTVGAIERLSVDPEAFPSDLVPVQRLAHIGRNEKTVVEDMPLKITEDETSAPTSSPAMDVTEKVETKTPEKGKAEAPSANDGSSDERVVIVAKPADKPVTPVFTPPVGPMAETLRELRQRFLDGEMTPLEYERERRFLLQKFRKKQEVMEFRKIENDLSGLYEIMRRDIAKWWKDF